MSRTHPSAPTTSQIAALNASLASHGIALGASEATEGGRWSVMIEAADAPAEFTMGPSPGHAWQSALVWVGG